MGSVTNALGLTRPEVEGPSMAGIDQQIGNWQNTASGLGPSIAENQYKTMANQGMGNVLAGMAQSKGLRPSAQATMAGMMGSQMQGQAAQQGATMGLQERQLANQNIASMLMGQAGINQQTSIANANLESQQAGRLGNTIGGLAGVGAGAGYFGSTIQDAVKNK
jgi:hypothetical protein